MPVYVYVAGDDIFCPAAQALWTAEQIDSLREVRMFDEQGHDYFTYAMDYVLMESLLFALGQKENTRKTKFHHNWEVYEENSLMGFAPFYMPNRAWQESFDPFYDPADPFNIH